MCYSSPPSSLQGPKGEKGEIGEPGGMGLTGKPVSATVTLHVYTCMSCIYIQCVCAQLSLTLIITMLGYILYIHIQNCMYTSKCD